LPTISPSTSVPSPSLTTPSTLRFPFLALSVLLLQRDDTNGNPVSIARVVAPDRRKI
jgi:hypothetical protein